MNDLLPPPCIPPAPPARYATVFADARFRVEMVPEPLWGLTLQKSLPPAEWQRMRADIFTAARYRCEACGAADELQCHEQWAYDDDRCRQTLAELVALCPACHAAKTPGRAVWLMQTGQVPGRDLVAEVEARIADLNGWDAATTEAYIDWCAHVNMVRSRYRWTPAARPRNPGAGATSVGDHEVPCSRCFMLTPRITVDAEGAGTCRN